MSRVEWEGLMESLGRVPPAEPAARRLLDLGRRLGVLEESVVRLRSSLGATDPAAAALFLGLVWEAGWGLGDPLLQVPGPVTAEAWSPDGSRLAAGTGAGGTFVFSARDGRRLGRLAEGHPIHHVEFSPDGSALLATGGTGLHAPDPRLDLWVAGPTGEGARRLGSIPTPRMPLPRTRLVGRGWRHLLVEAGEGPPKTALVVLPGPAVGLVDLAGAFLHPLAVMGDGRRIKGGASFTEAPWLVVEARTPTSRFGEACHWFLVDPVKGILRDLELRSARPMEWTCSADGTRLAGRGIMLSEERRALAGSDPLGAHCRFSVTVDPATGGVLERVIDPAPLEPGPPPPRPRFVPTRYGDGWRPEAPDLSDPAGPLPGLAAGPIDALSVFAGGSRLVVYGTDEGARVFDLATGRPLPFQPPADLRIDVGAAAAPRLLARSPFEARILEGDELGRRPRRRPRWAQHGCVRCGVLSADGRLMVLGTERGSLFAYPDGPRERGRLVATAKGPVAAVGFLGDGGRLWYLSDPGGPCSIGLGADPAPWAWDTRPDGSYPRQVFAHPTAPGVAALVGGVPVLLPLGRQDRVPLFPDREPVFGFALAPDGSAGARALVAGTLEVWTLPPAPARLLARVDRDLARVWAMAFVPGRSLLLYSQAHHVRALAYG